MVVFHPVQVESTSDHYGEDNLNIVADYDRTARFARSQVMAFIDRPEDETRTFFPCRLAEHWPHTCWCDGGVNRIGARDIRQVT